MSNPEEEEIGISDDQLPDDLTPTEDNPLAEGLDDGETVDDLMDGGKGAETSVADPSDDENSHEEED
jgi:hypothetical protein